MQRKHIQLLDRDEQRTLSCIFTQQSYTDINTNTHTPQRSAMREFVGRWPRQQSEWVCVAALMRLRCTLFVLRRSQRRRWRSLVDLNRVHAHNAVHTYPRTRRMHWQTHDDDDDDAHSKVHKHTHTHTNVCMLGLVLLVVAACDGVVCADISFAMYKRWHVRVICVQLTTLAADSMQQGI